MLADNLFRLLHKDDSRCEIRLSSKEHPVFEAHFPNNPLLPGFLQIDILASIYHKEVIEVANTKFMHPIYPNTHLIYRLKEAKNAQMIINLEDSEHKALSLIKLKWRDV